MSQPISPASHPAKKQLPEVQTRETLLLIRNNYKAWAVDRAPGLLQRYKDVISLLDNKN
jgi:hypothetical protein